MLIVEYALAIKMTDVEASPELDRLTYIAQDNLNVVSRATRNTNSVKSLHKIWSYVKYLATLLTILLGIIYIVVLLATDTSKVLAAIGAAQEIVDALALRESNLDINRTLQLANKTLSG